MCNHYLYRQQFCFFLLIFFLLPILGACTTFDTNQESPGVVYDSVPKHVDSKKKYLFYIHGLIIESQGINAVSPEFGEYHFTEILEYFSEAGYIVIGEVRGPTPDPNLYAEKLIKEIKNLQDQGVDSKDINLVGFSKGAGLLIHTSTKLMDPEINFVLIAICGKWLEEDPSLSFSGRVLSIYEESDSYGSSCQSIADRSPNISYFEEFVFNTGKKHGAFYSADPLWMDPVINWLEE